MAAPAPAPKKVHPADVVRFVLRRCKLRGDRIVPTEEDTVEFSWRSLCAKFAPTKSRTALMSLRSMQLGSFVGLVDGPAGPSNFVFMNADRSGKLGSGLIKDDDFPKRVIEVFRVEHVDWSTKTIELGVGR